MATENLKFVIEGEVGGGISSIDKLISAIDKLTSALTKTQSSLLKTDVNITKSTSLLDKFGNEISQTASSGEKLASGAINMSSAIQKTATPLNNLKRTSSGANFAILSLTQGIQDLPFGFIAIQNNIEQLFTSFIRLKTETGTFKSAISAMGTALTGPAGLGLAFSAVISALTYFSLKNRGAKKDVDEFKQSIDNIQKSLKTYGDALASGTSDAQKEIITLKLLYDATQNQGLALQSRINAANKLKELYPQQLKNLSQDQILAGNAASAYNLLAANILKVATAQGFANSITQNAEKQADIMGKIFDLTAKQGDLTKDLTNKQKAYNEQVKATANVGTTLGGPGALSANDKLLKQLDEAKGKLQDNKDQVKQLLTQYESFGKTNINLSKAVNIDDFIKGMNEAKNKGDELKTISDIIKQLQDDFETINTKAKILGLTIGQIGALKMEALSKAIEDVAKIHTPAAIQKGKEWLAQLKEIAGSLSAASIGSQPQINLPQSNPQTPGYIDPTHEIPGQKKQQEIADKTYNDVLRDRVKIARQLEGVFEDVFSTIAGGGNVFDALIKSIEKLIIKLAAAAAAAALLNALLPGFGGTAPGFRAIFSQLSGLQGLTSFASGGFIPTPQLAVVGDAPGGEWVLNQRQMSTLLNGVGQQNSLPSIIELRAKGNDLVGVINSTNKRNSRIN